MAMLNNQMVFMYIYMLYIVLQNIIHPLFH